MRAVRELLKDANVIVVTGYEHGWLSHNEALIQELAKSLRECHRLLKAVADQVKEGTCDEKLERDIYRYLKREQP